MKKIYFKYYCVFETSAIIKEVSVIDLKPATKLNYLKGLPLTSAYSTNSKLPSGYSLLPYKDRFYGYVDKIKAMENAKKKAISYINVLTKDIMAGINTLKKYREDNYTELNITLIDSNIRMLEREMNIK